MTIRALMGQLIAGGLVALAVVPTSASSAGIRVKPTQIMDNAGFDRPLVAATLMVPTDMTSRGGVRWRNRPEDCPKGFTFDWQASSPDGLSTITIFPGEQWGQSSAGNKVGEGCHVAAITTAREFLKAWADIYRKGAQILDYRDRFDLEQQSAALNQQQNIGSMRSQTRADGGEVLLGYSFNGQPVREAVAVVIVVTDMLFGGGGVTPDTRTVFGYSMPGFAMRAPAGQLHFANMEKLRQSIQPGQEWSQRIAQHNQVMSRQNMDHSKKMHAIRMKGIADVGRINSQIYNDRNKAMDRNQREFTEYIRGTETWNTADGRTRELDQSNHAWQLDNGNFVTTDDPNWQPADAGLNGQQLQRTR